MATLTLGLDDPQALKALFEQHLSKGRAFVAGATGVGMTGSVFKGAGELRSELVELGVL